MIANYWLRNEASRCSAQLDMLDEIDLYARLVLAFEERAGRLSASLEALITGGLLNGLSVDSVGHQNLFTQNKGMVNVFFSFRFSYSQTIYLFRYRDD